MTSRRLLDPATKVLLNAADMIERRGWWDGIGLSEERLCAVSAISVVSSNGHHRGGAIRKLTNYLGLAHDRSVVSWNDTNSALAVIAALRAAAMMEDRP